MMALDVPYLLERAGGPQALLNLLARHSDVVPNYATIQMWSARRAIPGKWVGLVIYVMAKEFGLGPFEMTSDMGDLAGDDF